MVLFYLRLYSGLRDSVESGVWNPSGVPTIVRMIEAVERSGLPYQFVFYSYERLPDAIRGKRYVEIEGLKKPVKVISIRCSLSDRIQAIFLGIASVFFSIRYSAKLFYTDRSNVVGAAFVQRMGISRCVLRLLGFPPPLFEQVKKMNGGTLGRWAFNSPFSLVIGTNDGSSVRQLCEQLMNPDLEYEIVTNGIDRQVDSGRRSRSGEAPLQVVTVGRLEESKCCVELIHAWECFIDSGGVGNLVIVGEGALSGHLKELVEEKNLTECIQFSGAVQQRDVLSILNNFDIYVSFNEGAQLTNTNLEALRSGLAIILAESKGDDEAAKEAGLDENIVAWIERRSLSVSFSKVLMNFYENPSELKRVQDETAAKGALMQTWEERMDWEVDQLRGLLDNAS